ncbi:MAG: F0F1 ATP synthase subunit B [Phycisphaerales bacterium]|nr:F0F1 ATP synthase subunit B [Phycisphaerales bacterium]
MQRIPLLLLTVVGLVLALGSPTLAQHDVQPPTATSHESAAPTDDAAHISETPHEQAGHATHAPEGDVLPPWWQGAAPLLAAWIVFGAVFIVLGKTVWPKILSGLNDREQKIKQEIESAEAARRQANEALEQYQANLAEARAEAAAMIEKTRAAQRALADELHLQSERELADMKQRATQDIEAAKRAAMSEIYTLMANLATSVAGRILEREIKPEDHKALVDDALSELGSFGRN